MQQNDSIFKMEKNLVHNVKVTQLVQNTFMDNYRALYCEVHTLRLLYACFAGAAVD